MTISFNVQNFNKHTYSQLIIYKKLKKMKKITSILTLGILLLFVFTLQLSAQKCKFDYNKTDPITGESTQGNTFSIDRWWKMGYNKTGNTYYLGMFIQYGGQVREIISKGDPITFKLSNGEIITVIAQEESLPVSQAYSTGVATFYSGKYEIDAVTIQKMAENPPTFSRIKIGSMVYEKEISAKDGKKISDAAKCILQ
jgi:hypothetical protein